MHVFSKATLCLALTALAGGAQAQVNNNPRTIFGTYKVVATHRCWATTEAGPGQSPFAIGSGGNGLPQVTYTGSPANLDLENTVSHMTLVIDPKGTLSSQDLIVNRMDENRPPKEPILQRMLRTMQGSFAVDAASNTLLLRARTEIGTLPNGNSSTWVWEAGARWQTTDLGQTFTAAESDQPLRLEQSVTDGATTSWYSVICTHTVLGQRVSPRF